MISQQQLFSIAESSAAAEARRAAAEMARRLSFDETGIGEVSLVVSEAATNLAKYATHGQLLLRVLESGGSIGLEALTLDSGPGIANVAEALRDGYSTAGSPGTGLGAISRIADEFDIYSAPGKGTALVARLWARTPVGTTPSSVLASPGTMKVGVVCLPKPGEAISGDAWAIEWRAGRGLAMVVDGLGHGPDAAAASSEAVEVLRAQSQLSPGALIEYAHGALRHTRGAALAVVELKQTGELSYAGIGNIAGIVISPDRDRHMVSHNGIVGHELRKVQEFVYSLPQQSLLVMHSDGLASHWSLNQYPGLANRHPSLIAGILYRDFTRGRDDVTVLVISRQ